MPDNPLQDTKQQLDELIPQIRHISEGFATLADSIDKTSAPSKAFSKNLKDTKDRMYELKRQINEAQGKYGKLSGEVTIAEEKFREARKEMLELLKAQKMTDAEMKKLESSVSGATAIFGKYADGVAKTGKSLRIFGGLLKNYGAALGATGFGIKEAVGETKTYDEALYKLSRTQQVAGRGTKDLGGAFDIVRDKTALSKIQFMEFTEVLLSGYVGVKPTTKAMAELAAIMTEKFGPSIDKQKGAWQTFADVQSKYPALAKLILSAQKAIASGEVEKGKAIRNSVFMQMHAMNMSVDQQDKMLQLMSNTTKDQNKLISTNRELAKVEQARSDALVSLGTKGKAATELAAKGAQKFYGAIGNIPVIVIAAKFALDGLKLAKVFVEGTSASQHFSNILGKKVGPKVIRTFKDTQRAISGVSGQLSKLSTHGMQYGQSMATSIGLQVAAVGAMAGAAYAAGKLMAWAADSYTKALEKEIETTKALHKLQKKTGEQAREMIKDAERDLGEEKANEAIAAAIKERERLWAEHEEKMKKKKKEAIDKSIKVADPVTFIREVMFFKDEGPDTQKVLAGMQKEASKVLTGGQFDVRFGDEKALAQPEKLAKSLDKLKAKQKKLADAEARARKLREQEILKQKQAEERGVTVSETDDGMLEEKWKVMGEIERATKEVDKATQDVANEWKAVQTNISNTATTIKKLEGALREQIGAGEQIGVVYEEAYKKMVMAAEMAATTAKEAMASTFASISKIMEDSSAALPETIRKAFEDINLKGLLDGGGLSDAEEKKITKLIEKIQQAKLEAPPESDAYAILQTQLENLVRLETDLGEVRKQNTKQALVQSETATKDARTQEKIHQSLQGYYEAETKLMESAQFGMGASVEMLQKQVTASMGFIKTLEKTRDQLAENHKITEEQAQAMRSAKSSDEAQKLARELATQEQSEETLLKYAQDYWKTSQDIASQKQKIYDLTKEMREGYMSAIREMSVGAGEFAKIIGTQTMGFSQLMKITKEVTGYDKLNTMIAGGATTKGSVGAEARKKPTGIITTEGVRFASRERQEAMNTDIYNVRQDHENLGKTPVGAGAMSTVELYKSFERWKQAGGGQAGLEALEAPSPEQGGKLSAVNAATKAGTHPSREIIPKILPGEVAGVVGGIQSFSSDAPAPARGIPVGAENMTVDRKLESIQSPASSSGVRPATIIVRLDSALEAEVQETKDFKIQLVHGAKASGGAH